MSYSRWSNSVWYTFYAVSSSMEKEDQIFEVCSVASFTYKQIKEDIEGCLDEVSKIEPDVSADNMGELREYMDFFIKDVEEDKTLKAYEELMKDNDLAKFVLFAEDYLENNNDHNLKDILDIINTPKKKLPLMINNLDSGAVKSILKKRLSGELP